MKVIEKCKAMCEKEIARLKEEYDEAQGNYGDTGYDRYYKKMCKTEDAIEELEKFLYGDAMAKDKARRYENMYNELKEGLYFVNKMIDNLTDDDFTSPRVNEIINHLQRMR